MSSPLTAGAQELADRFRERFAQLSTAEKEKPGFEIHLPGRYAYSAATSAFWALGKEFGYPNLNWTMQGVTFVLKSGIPSTVGILNGPTEIDYLRESVIGYSFCILAPLAILIALLLCYRIPEAEITYRYALACFIAPMCAGIALTMIASEMLPRILANLMYKR